MTEPTATTQPPFATGDIVRLRSGGLEMAVREAKKRLVTCDWCEGNRMRRDSFYAAQLVSTERKMDVVETARRIAFILNSVARKRNLSIESGSMSRFLEDLSKDDRTA